MTRLTVEGLANTVAVPVERLLEHFKDAGLSQKKDSDIVTNEDKYVLLEYLRKLGGTEGGYKVNKTNDDSPVDIRNCKFAFRCTQTWGSLSVTNDKAIRYCSDCDRGVHLCETNEELLKAMRENWCVAIDVPDPRIVSRLIGDVVQPEFLDSET